VHLVDISIALVMGLQTFYINGPNQLLWAGSRAETGQTTSGRHNCINYCEIFIVHFENVAVGRIIQSGGPHAALGFWIGDPWPRSWFSKHFCVTKPFQNLAKPMDPFSKKKYLIA
jgi:hypothetical protein